MKYLVYFFLLFSSLQANEFKKGNELVRQKDYVQAYEHFHQAAKSGNSAALFAIVVCEVALGKHEMAAKHLDQIYQLTSAPCKQCGKQSEQSDTHPPETAQEQVSAYECRLQVRKSAQDLRKLVETIVIDTVPGLFRKIQTFRQLNPYIDRLERIGLACCQNTQAIESCTEPLVEQLKLWDSEGLPLKQE